MYSVHTSHMEIQSNLMTEPIQKDKQNLTNREREKKNNELNSVDFVLFNFVVVLAAVFVVVFFGADFQLYNLFDQNNIKIKRKDQNQNKKTATTAAAQ